MLPPIPPVRVIFVEGGLRNIAMSQSPSRSISSSVIIPYMTLGYLYSCCLRLAMMASLEIIWANPPIIHRVIIFPIRVRILSLARPNSSLTTGRTTAYRDMEGSLETKR
jgi:hypothetical protein